jgi:hypothetical protein
VCGIACEHRQKVIRTNNTARAAEVPVKLGHCGFQIRTKGSELGQHPQDTDSKTFWRLQAGAPIGVPAMEIFYSATEAVAAVFCALLCGTFLALMALIVWGCP